MDAPAYLRMSLRVTSETAPSRVTRRVARETSDSSVSGDCRSRDDEASTAATKYSPGGRPETSKEPFGADDICLMCREPSNQVSRLVENAITAAETRSFSD